MLIKNYSRTGRKCRVTFRLPPEIGAASASLLGEFNDWNPEANPMTRLKDGGFSATISLDSGNSYRFRYLLDGEQWENDWEADQYLPNDYGSDDSVVTV